MLIKPAVELSETLGSLQTDVSLTGEKLTVFIQNYEKEKAGKGRRPRGRAKSVVFDVIRQAGPEGIGREELARRLEAQTGKVIKVQTLAARALPELIGDGSVIRLRKGVYAVNNPTDATVAQ